MKRDMCRTCEAIEWAMAGYDQSGLPIEYGECQDCGATYIRVGAEEAPSLIWLCFKCKWQLPTAEISDADLSEGVEIDCPHCGHENHIEGLTGASDSVGVNDSVVVHTHY